MAVVKVLRGPDPGSVHEIKGERTVIGRHPNSHLVFDNGAISRHHAQILESHGSYYLEDLRSRNNTYLNGELVEGRTELQDGDQIRLCDIVLTFLLQPSSLDSSALQHAESANSTVEAGLLDRTTEAQPTVDESNIYNPEQGLSDVAFESSSVVSKIDARQRRELTAGVRSEIKLKAVLAITQALSRELELDSVLPKILTELFNTFPQAAQGFVLLKDTESGKLKIKATRIRKGGEDDAVAVSMTVVRHAMETGEALLSENVLDDSRFKQSSSLSKMKIRSMMCAPLVGQEGRSLGVIQMVTRGEQQVFNADDLDLLVSVASQAALTIENATLHEEVLRQRELERDLEFATQVQLGFLPKSRPKVPHYAFADYYEAALRIGGDYFDYITLHGGRIAVALGDVAGKGVPAALLMARLYSSTRFQLLTVGSPGGAVTGLNREISSSGLGHRFITFLVLVLDPKTHQVTLVNAGHLPPLVRRANGQVQEVGREESSLPLGIIPEQEYREVTFSLAPGDSIIAYTDGVTESMNDERQIFGRERLERCIAASRGDIDAMVKEIVNDVEAFVSDNASRDDTCVVGLQRLPS